LLWSTGELRSVALLVLALQARGARATGLSVHETGLILPEGEREATHLQFDREGLAQALAQHPVAVVPGFLACRPSGAIVSLGRGGSDLTAVLLAARLGAQRCELIKDVPGYFDRDPNRHADARHVPALRFEEALAMAEAGCDLVQRQAIEAALHFGLPLVVRSLDDRGPCSWVGHAPVAPGRGERAEVLCHFPSRGETIPPQKETTP
jgi:aspartate kinase